MQDEKALARISAGEGPITCCRSPQPPLSGGGLFLHFLVLGLDDVVLFLPLALRAPSGAAGGTSVTARRLGRLRVHRLRELVRRAPELVGRLADGLRVLQLEGLLRLRQRALDVRSRVGVAARAVL